MCFFIDQFGNDQLSMILKRSEFISDYFTIQKVNDGIMNHSYDLSKVKPTQMKHLCVPVGGQQLQNNRHGCGMWPIN